MTLQRAIADALHHLRAGRAEHAIAALQDLCARSPGSLAAHNALGSALGSVRRHAAAEVAFRRALALQPEHAQVRTNLASVQLDAGAVVQARIGFERAIASGRAPVQAQLGLGHALLLLGESSAASAAFGRASELAPDSAAVHSRRCYAALLDPELSAGRVVELHREYDALATAEARAHTPLSAGARASGAKLRIGYVSADFREHSVASFIEGVLAAHDLEAIELFLYSDVVQADATTARLAALADHYRATAGLPDAELAAQVRADRIDALIDLGGHMHRNRLLVFARRPAPVLLTYLGYPGTTGLSAFAGRITDAWADPNDSPALAGSEPLLRVEHGCFAYTPPADAPTVASLPAQRVGHVTFGCFNDVLKLNDRVLARFGEIVARSYGSRLVLKAAALAFPDVRMRVLATLANHGVASGRVDFLPWSASRREHLAQYARVDIALDTFPYAGATTTCEALYMGVPVVTLQGDRHAGRMGVSILSAVGLPSFIAASEAAYVDLALAQAARLEALAGLRASLRTQLHASALCDGRRIASCVERSCAALRDEEPSPADSTHPLRRASGTDR